MGESPEGDSQPTWHTHGEEETPAQGKGLKANIVFLLP